MRHFDLTPLLRSSVGFDHLNRLMDSARTSDASPAYPPYNIEKLSEDDYQITMAVAGFGRDELDVTLEDGVLIITGRAKEEDGARTFLHQGIAKRAFDRRFELAETIKVGDAQFENGLLTVSLYREIPEHKKPRKIEIRAEKAKSNVKTLDMDAA